MMNCNLYTLWKDFCHLVNTLHSLHIYIERERESTFKFYSVSKFQLYSTVLSTIVTMFYIRYSDLIHLIAESFYLFTSLSLFPLSLTPGNHFSTLCFCFCFFKIYLFIAVLGLHFCARAFSSCGHSSSRCADLPLSRPLLLRSTGSRRAGSVIVAHGTSCSVACGIFPDQGSNPCPLH